MKKHEYEQNKSFFTFRNIGILQLIGAFILVGLPISSSANPPEGAKLEEVVVTGSLIRRKQDFETASPVQTMGGEEIGDAGATRIQDIFKGMTANSGSQIANRQNELQGLSQFSLRGLGVGSTLTLVNGRRAGLAPATDSSGQLFTDINQFPVNMIERIEVLADGASSTYGSEAVAGVVNIYTRNDFEGFEITAEGRTSVHDAHQIGFAVGSSHDEGHFSLFVNHAEQGGSTRSDFDFLTRGNKLSDGKEGTYTSGTGSPGRFNLATETDGEFKRSGDSLADPDCQKAGGIPEITTDGTNCRYHFIDQRRMIAEEIRTAVFSQFDYDLTEQLSLFGELSFSRNEVRDGIGGVLFRVFPDDGGFYVPKDHPFNFFIAKGADGIEYIDPDKWDSANHAAEDLIYRGRALGADADGDNLADAKTVFSNFRFAGGFDYDIDDNWLLHANYVFTNSDYTRAQPRDWDPITFAQQIKDGNWNPFGTRLTNPDLVSPKDKDKEQADQRTAGNSDTVLNTFALVKNDQRNIKQSVMEAILSGQTDWELSGGNVAVAVGAQYRALELEDIPDSRYQVLFGGGRNRLNESLPVIFGTQDAYGVFGEISLPMTEELELNAALRYEDYGDEGGDTMDPKLTAKWNLTEQLSLRATLGSSFQAPSIRQMLGTRSTGSIEDPRNTEEAFKITVFTEGSSDLTSQSAKNKNLGLVYRSDNGLDVSVDYWMYDYNDLIIPDASPQYIFDTYDKSEDSNCNDIKPTDRAVRSPDCQPAYTTGKYENRGNAEAAGFDLVGKYSFEMDDLGLFKLNMSSTIITKYTSSQFGDIKGSRNYENGFGSTPDFKANAGLTWEIDDHLVNITARYIGSYKDDQKDKDIDAQTTMDVRYQTYIDDMLGGSTTLGIGVTNLFDKEPPPLASRPLYDEEVHDPRGRQIYINLKQSF